MSVPVQNPINQIVIVGGETLIPWTWNLQQQSEITVLVQRASTGLIDTLTLDADYTVDANGLDNDSGGNINPIGSESPVTTGDIWTLFRVTAIDRSPDFATSGAFFASTINEQLDELTRIAQDNNRDSSEAVRKDPGVGDTLDRNIPQMVDERALKFRDTGGGNFEMVMSDNDPDQQANDAAVSAAAALASEQAAAVSEGNAAQSAADTQAKQPYLGTSQIQSSNLVLTGSAENGFIFRADTSGADIDITLPDSTTLTADYRIAIVIEVVGNNINVKRAGTDTINGSASDFVITQLEDINNIVLDQSTGKWIASSSFTDLSSPDPIGDVTPNAIDGTVIKATTRFEGPLGITNPSTVKATTFQAEIGTTINEFSTDGTLAGNSDDAVPTEQSVKTFVESTNVASQAEMEAASSLIKKVTPGRQKFHPGTAKAWLRYDQKIPSILASYNITSVTDHSTGNFTVVFDVDFSSANYAFGCTSDDTAALNKGNICQDEIRSAPVAASCAFTSYQTADNATDDRNNYITFFGDQ